MMPPLPPLNLSFGSSATSGLQSNGASFAASGAGDWNVNLAGSGISNQSAGGGSIPWKWILILGAAWLVLK